MSSSSPTLWSQLARPCSKLVGFGPDLVSAVVNPNLNQRCEVAWKHQCDSGNTVQRPSDPEQSLEEPMLIPKLRLSKPWSTCYQAFTSHFSSLPEMPPFEYQPLKYEGSSYEKVLNIKEHHLFPSVTPYYKKPLLIHDGKMQWLFDHKGRRFLDMFGGIVTVSVGHCHPLSDKVAYKAIIRVVYFVNSGSEANDVATMLARLHTKNYDIVSFKNSFHGASMGAMGLTALSQWRFNVPTAHGVHHAMNPDVYQGLWGGSKCRDSPVQTSRECSCSEGHCKASEMYYGQLEEVFKYSLPRGKVAGLFAESIQGVGGTVQFPKGFLKKAYELVKINGGVCIADEVQTGFGRTGEHFWGFQMHDVKPDIVTMAKGIGNGFPLGAVATTPEIAETFTQALHFNTYGGNPIALAVGSAVLQLEKLRDEFDCVGDVRGKGLMIGVELVSNKETRAPLPAKSFTDIWEDCKDMGLLLGRGGLYANVFRIKPPMCITKEDADFTVEVMKAALIKFTEKSKQ
uniref:Alanine--glyoxylate aminotransferase 2, mitochondrial n=2 Tax=Timema TaxID=61471 RepID=A0A7R9AZH6_TIMSH|nr:unnamed protein product [Timema shepardi]